MMAYLKIIFAFVVLLSLLPGCRKPDDLLPATEFSGVEVVEPAPLYEIVNLQKPPLFPGGETALSRFLFKHIQYPGGCSEITGICVISFEIQTDGKTGDLNILKLPHPCFEPMIAEMFAQMPPWTPGELNGKPVRSRMVLPIRICLE